MDDRIALRLGALRLARRRGRTREAAWAAARLRLPGVTLGPAEARFARETRVKLGRAIRSGRIIRPRRSDPEDIVPAVPLVPPRSWPTKLIAAAVAAALLLGAILLYFQIQEPAGEAEGVVSSELAATIATQPPPLRGRTQPGLALPVVLVVATPAPANVPPASAPPANGGGVAGGGSGSGGSGGGSGGGGGNGTPAPTPKPTATPTPVPTPTINPANLVHVVGRVIDSSTRRGLPSVCIALGALDCSAGYSTDANGNFDIPLDGRSSWIFRFIKQGYFSATLNNVRLRPGPPINVGTISLRKGP
jgi:hypothetical protein